MAKLFFFFMFIFTQVSVAKEVIINNQVLSDSEIDAIEMQLGYDIQSGRYWYDSKSGLWGEQNRGASGVIAAELISTCLPEDISCSEGDTWLNGRRLPASELSYYQRHFNFPIASGKYWLDKNGRGGQADKVLFCFKLNENERGFNLNSA